MYLKTLKSASILCLASLTLLLAACNTSGVSIREGKAGNETTTSIFAQNSALVVHVDDSERIATIRRGFDLGEEFLISVTANGVETAVLKGRARSASEGLMTADILEGMPQINNIVIPAKPERSKKLARIYTEPDA